MGWPSTLTYREIVALNVERSVGVLAHYGDVSAAQRVFSDNPALANDSEALENAARNGHETFVRLMLRYQPELATRIAVVAKTRELTELLFAHGMNPSLPDWLLITPLHRFAQRGDVESAAIFVEHGANLHARDEDIRSTPLGWAAKFGKIRMVEFLLKCGAKVNLPDDPPWATPLAWASSRRHEDVVALLERAQRA
jgi:ankyrin repeat protein